MKRIFLLSFFLLSCVSASHAQSLIIGEKVDIRVDYMTSPPDDGLPSIVEFFSSRGASSAERVTALNSLAADHSGRLNVILVTRDERSTVEPLLKDAGFFVGFDPDGRTFKKAGVQYVPFAIILDARGRIVWFGNPSNLTGSDIKSALGW